MASAPLAVMMGLILSAGAIQAESQSAVSVGPGNPAVIYAADLIPGNVSDKYFVGTRINETTQEEENIGVVFVEKYNTKYVEYEIGFTAEETDYYDISYYLSDGAVWKSYADVYMDGEPTRQRIQDLSKSEPEYGWTGNIGNAGTIDVKHFIPKKWTAPKVLLEKGGHTLKLRFQKSMNATIYSFDKITIESAENAVINEGAIEAEDFKWAETGNKSFPSRAFTNASAGNAVKIDSGIRAEDSETFKAVFDAAEDGEYKIEIGAGAYYAGRETFSPMMVSVNGEVLGRITKADGTGADFVSEETPYDTSDKEISLYKFTGLKTASLKKGENTISFTVLDRKDNMLNGENAGYRGYMAAIDYVKAEKVFTVNAPEAIFCGKQSAFKIYDGDNEISKDEYSITYSSSDNTAVSVDENGIISGIGEGNAVISAYICKNGETQGITVSKTIWATNSGLYIKELMGGKGGKCTFTIGNISEKAMAVTATCGNYGSDRLTEVRVVSDCTVDAGKTVTKTVEFENPTSVKLFVWNNLDKMDPLTKSAKL